MITIQIWPVSIRQAAGPMPMLCEVNILFWWFNDGLQIYNLYMFIFIIREEIAKISKEGWALKNHFIWGYPPNLCTHSRQQHTPGQILKLFNSTLRQLMNSDRTLIFSLQLNYQNVRKNTRCNYFRIICVSSWFCHKQNIKMSEVHRMKVYVSHCHRECSISSSLASSHQPWCQYSLSPELTMTRSETRASWLHRPAY